MQCIHKKRPIETESRTHKTQQREWMGVPLQGCGVSELNSFLWQKTTK